MAVAGRDRDDARRNSSPQPWHNRTSTLLGASALALALIGLLIVVAMAVARQFSEPAEAPLDFVEPTFSATATQPAATAPTTTQTITSTSPPQTTDIDGAPTTSTSTTSSSETTSDETTARRDGDDNDDRPSRTTRRGPRTNVTRTFNPYP